MRHVALFGVVIGLFSVIAALTSALMYKNGSLSLGTALGEGFRYGVWGAIAGLGIIFFAGLVQLLSMMRFNIFAVAGSVVTFGFLAMVVPQILIARTVPPIHDITTDTDNPSAPIYSGTGLFSGSRCDRAAAPEICL
jgi:hypothetical protein